VFDESVESIEKRWTGVKITKGQVKNLTIEAARNFEEFYSPKNVKESDSTQNLPLIILTLMVKVFLK